MATLQIQIAEGRNKKGEQVSTAGVPCCSNCSNPKNVMGLPQTDGSVVFSCKTHGQLQVFLNEQSVSTWMQTKIAATMAAIGRPIPATAQGTCFKGTGAQQTGDLVIDAASTDTGKTAPPTSETK